MDSITFFNCFLKCALSIPIWSISHFVNIEQMGIDKVGK